MLSANVIAVCPAGSTVVGGACDWDDFDAAWSDARSYPDGNGWHCQSTDGSRRVRAHAFCHQ